MHCHQRVFIKFINLIWFTEFPNINNLVQIKTFMCAVLPLLPRTSIPCECELTFRILGYNYAWLVNVLFPYGCCFAKMMYSEMVAAGQELKSILLESKLSGLLCGCCPTTAHLAVEDKLWVFQWGLRNAKLLLECSCVQRHLFLYLVHWKQGKNKAASPT